LKNVAPLDTANDNVLEKTGNVKSGVSACWRQIEMSGVSAKINGRYRFSHGESLFSAI